jgi:hypothetical protein
VSRAVTEVATASAERVLGGAVDPETVRAAVSGYLVEAGVTR